MQGTDAKHSRSSHTVVLAVFICLLLLPMQPDLAGMRLDPYRAILMVSFFPLLILLAIGRAGRVTWIDFLILLLGLWSSATMAYHEGSTRMAYSAIYGIELVGGYLVGRILVRNLTHYRSFIRVMLVSLLILLPFALMELTSGRSPLLEAFGKFGPVIFKIIPEMRLGFYRTQSVFGHPILFGIYASIALANVVYLYQDSKIQMLLRVTLVVAVALTSLSSAPFLALGLQGMIIFWGKISNNRWSLLLFLFVSVIVFLQLASNRGPVILLIEKLTLDPQTAWWRVFIWEYGSLSVINNPWLGIGLKLHERPFWLTSSVDNFWLVIAMRHGLPAFAMLSGALALHVVSITRTKGLSPRAAAARIGYMIAFTGLVFVLCTVHAWDNLVVFIMFYFGAGAFFYTAPDLDLPADTSGPAVSASPRADRGALPHSRFAPRHTRSQRSDPRR